MNIRYATAGVTSVAGVAAVVASATSATAGTTPHQPSQPGHPALDSERTVAAPHPVVLEVHHQRLHRTVTVRGGDTLSGIAKANCGTAKDWTGIAKANQGQVPNPNLITPGEVLKLACRAVAYALPALAAPPPATTQSAPAQSAPADPPPPATVTSVSGVVGAGSFQQCVIQAESGGNPAAVNPSSGAGGLYGFLPSTWQGLGFSGLPEDASVAEQNAAFAKEYAQGGTSAWAAYDGC